MGGFHWGNASKFERKSPAELKDIIMSVNSVSDLGALLEINIRFPESLLDKFNEMPLFSVAQEGMSSSFV